MRSLVPHSRGGDGRGVALKYKDVSITISKCYGNLQFDSEHLILLRHELLW